MKKAKHNSNTRRHCNLSFVEGLGRRYRYSRVFVGRYKYGSGLYAYVLSTSMKSGSSDSIALSEATIDNLIKDLTDLRNRVIYTRYRASWDKEELWTEEDFEKIGIEYRDGYLPPVIEDDRDGTYIKFMSNGGHLDVEQAEQFEYFMENVGYAYTQHSERSFTVLGSALRIELGMDS